MSTGMFIEQGLKPRLFTRPYGTAKARALIRTCAWMLLDLSFLLTSFAKPSVAMMGCVDSEVQATSRIAQQNPQSAMPAANPQPSPVKGMQPAREVSSPSPAHQSSGATAQPPSPYD